jgi:co-chaperonin GroES (HSP10)
MLPFQDRAVLKRDERRPMDIRVGDRVLFGRYGGTWVKVAGEEIVAREEDIVAVIDEPPTVELVEDRIRL